MWANAQRDGRPSECRWRPVFNAANFGWRPLLECRAITLPRRETRWNFSGLPQTRQQISAGSANLECRSETCCARLVANVGRKKSSKSRHLGTFPQLCRAISSQLRHVSTIGKRQQYLLHMSPQYGELRPTCGWDPFVSLGHPCKFQQVSRLGSITARHSCSERQPNFAALNRGRHLYSAGRPSRWALAHILVGSNSFMSSEREWLPETARSPLM